MKEEFTYPLALKIRKLETWLLDDYMVGRMYESEDLKKCCSQILELLKIARGYLVIGKERKAARIYLRAIGLKNVVVFHFKLYPKYEDSIS